MFTFKCEQWVPQFILNDKNGYALAKAIEAALQYMNDKVQQGLEYLTDIDKMPEWQLDELAWETNCPYDYKADVEVKRKWIRDATALYGHYGTAAGIEKYMSAYFDESTVEECWEYGGDPFHFRIKFPASWTPEKVAWATKAIAMVKNVRSILDSYSFIGKWLQNLFVGCALYTCETGTYHLPAVELESDWYIDELGNMLLDEDSILLIVEGLMT